MEMQQEYLVKLSMIEQEASQLQERMQAIDENIKEMTAIKLSLLDIKSKKEILANLGKGIFAKAEVKEDKLFINVGKGIILKKTPKETERIIDEQIEKLNGGKEQIMNRLENMQAEMMNLVQEARSNVHDSKCCNEDCECEEPCDDCECEKR